MRNDLGFTEKLPLLGITDGLPELNAAERAVLNKWHDHVMRPENGGYDDLIIYAHPPKDRGELLMFQAPFSWCLALLSGEMPSLSQKIHCVAAGCLIYQDGQVLLSQRAKSMIIRPGVWSWSAAGGISICEAVKPCMAAKREAEEEVGLKSECIVKQGLFGHGLIAYRGIYEHWLVSKIVTKGFTPVPSPEEVESVMWVDPSQEIDLAPLAEEVQKWQEKLFA